MNCFCQVSYMGIFFISLLEMSNRMQVAKVSQEVVLKFAHETASVFYWIGLWTLLMPSDKDKVLLASLSCGIGAFALIILMSVEEFRKLKNQAIEKKLKDEKPKLKKIVVKR